MFEILILLFLNPNLLFAMDSEKLSNIPATVVAVTPNENENASLNSEPDSDMGTTEPPKINYRLPKIAKPRQCILKLVTYLDEDSERIFSFKGEVTINFVLTEKTQSVTVHSEGLTIDGIEMGYDGKEVNGTTWELDKEKNFLKINNPQQMMEPGVFDNYFIIKYHGKMSDDKLGFYKHHYNYNGTKR